MQLRPVAGRPAGPGLALKPPKLIIAHAAKATVPNRAPSNGLRPLLIPRSSHSSSSAPCTVRRMAGRCSSPPAPRTKARDEAEREAPQQAPAKQGEDQDPAAEREAVPRQRSMAYRLFADLYVCAYVCCYRTGELIVVNAQEGLKRLRRYVRDNFFNQKR